MLLFFYEGNDLQNNIIYKNNYNYKYKIKDKFRYYLPLLYSSYRILYESKKKLFKKDINQNKIKQEKSKIKNKFIVNNKIEIIDSTIQSPPIELSKQDLEISLNILFETITNLKKNNDNILLIYLPAPSSVLDLKDPVFVLKYFHNNKTNNKSLNELNNLSKYLRTEVKKFSIKENIEFLDVTENMRLNAKEKKIYGPIDFKHPNKDGYKVIARQIFNLLNS